MVTYLWTPKPRHCVRITKDKALYRSGMYKGFKERGEEVKRKRNIRHSVTDYAHILPKLHCPWNDTPKNEISPGLLYHGLRSTSVTERLNPPPPSHAAHPNLRDAPTEWYGRQGCDVTEMYTFLSRGRKPPSREYYYGREATDISDHLRIIPPIAKDGEESEFFGRPKSDVTDFNIFPPRIGETFSRSESCRPLGKCPPGVMVDFCPLVRDKDGKLLRPQPVSPPKSPPKSPKRHDPAKREPLKPGGGGILSQIVPGHSRSEAKRPLGQVPPGVMADYRQYHWDENGKFIKPPRKLFRDKNEGHNPRGAQPCSELGPNHHYAYERLHPLGKVPEGVMSDYHEVDRPPHKHTTDGLWSPPTEWPTLKVNSGQMSPSKNAKCSPGPMSQSEAGCNAADTLQGAKHKLQIAQLGRRGATVCPVHDGSILPPPIGPAANVKWPVDGELEQGPCGKTRSPTRSPKTEKSSSTPCSMRSERDNREPPCVGLKKHCDRLKHDPRIARPTAVCGSTKKCCGVRPEPACECVQPPNREFPQGYGSPSEKPNYPASNRPGSGESAAGSAKSASSARSPKTNVAGQRTREKLPISPITTPEHYQFPYFGHSKTYVTDPAVSPNLTPVGRRSMRLPGQEKQPFAGLPSSQGKCGLQEKKHLNPHLHDGKTSWFGRTKTFVTDPAVSPNLTPPNRG